jgi:hypothetical protein
MEIAMRMPQGYAEIVAAGTRTLRSVEARLRSEAGRHPEAPELWLTIRDVAGLAWRLETMDEWEWRTGFADMMINGQDLGVLDELVVVASSPEVHTCATAHGREREGLIRLRAFVGSYCGGEYEFDSLRAPESASDAPAT